MAVLMFKITMIKPILSGELKQLILRKRKTPLKVGSSLYCYVNNAFKKHVAFANLRVTAIEELDSFTDRITFEVIKTKIGKRGVNKSLTTKEKEDERD